MLHYVILCYIMLYNPQHLGEESLEQGVFTVISPPSPHSGSALSLYLCPPLFLYVSTVAEAEENM